MWHLLSYSIPLDLTEDVPQEVRLCGARHDDAILSRGLPDDVPLVCVCVCVCDSTLISSLNQNNDTILFRGMSLLANTRAYDDLSARAAAPYLGFSST